MSIHCHSLSSSTSNEIYFYFDIFKFVVLEVTCDVSFDDTQAI